MQTHCGSCSSRIVGAVLCSECGNLVDPDESWQNAKRFAVGMLVGTLNWFLWWWMLLA